MRTLDDPIKGWSEWEKARAAIKAAKPVCISGCIESQRLHLFSALTQDYPIRLLLTPDEGDARKIADEYRFYDKNALYYPAKDLFFYQADLHGNALSAERLKTLRTLLSREDRSATLSIITTIDSLLTPVLPLSEYQQFIREIALEDAVSEQEIAHSLVQMGYERDFSADAPGKFSIRGDIIDVYDPTQDTPIRIELWGDQVTSLRSFDPESQRSVQKLERTVIFPATELPLADQKLRDGLAIIKKESQSRVQELREAMKTEESHRLKKAIEILFEETEANGRPSNPDGYVNFFYKNTCSLLELLPVEETAILLDEPARLKEELERIAAGYEESLNSRFEGGYILPLHKKLSASSNKNDFIAND